MVIIEGLYGYYYFLKFILTKVFSRVFKKSEMLHNSDNYRIFMENNPK